jgi:hypothetical protein
VMICRMNIARSGVGGYIVMYSLVFLVCSCWGFLALSYQLSYMVAIVCICDMGAIWKCI